jgi:hypothetical protein
MAIINRNYFMNQVKCKRDKSEKGGGRRRVYFDKSCPKCGLPREFSSVSLNRFSADAIGCKKLKCRMCGGLL